MRKIIMLFFLTLLVSIPTLGKKESNQPDFKIGLIADCQYADIPNKKERLYRRCPKKIQQAVDVLNKKKLKQVIHLGDYIEERWQSFAVMERATKKLKHPLKHVLGNHDFSVADALKLKVPEKMKVPSRYYAETIKNWRFIYLDGNDVSLYAWPLSSEKNRLSRKLFKEKYSNKKVWNGALGREQLSWLKQQLKDSVEQQQKVIVFCHFQLLPDKNHSLWNSQEVIAMLEQYPTVKAYVSGHQHTGDYVLNNGIHYLTLHAMLDTEETAFSELWFYPNQLRLKGYGRQPSIQLNFSAAEH